MWDHLPLTLKYEEIDHLVDFEIKEY